MVAKMRDGEQVVIVHEELGEATVSYGAFTYSFAAKGWELKDAPEAPTAPEPESDEDAPADIDPDEEEQA